MSSTTIASLLAGTWRDPESGDAVHVPMRNIVIADRLDSEAELVAGLRLGRKLTVVDDPATAAVLGDRVAQALGSIAGVDRLRLSDRPHADEATVARLQAESATADALVAVGSGTINDLCKMAAFRASKPYVVFATAPSMNGYTSANAAITVGGHKRSLPARLPVGAFFDLAVLSAAPKRMIQSGLGDSLCRPTAQADWLLSHSLRGTPYREAPFALLAEEEEALFAEAGALLRGDLPAVARLVRTLVLSGLGMVLCGGSFPASQGEHLISHYAEMMGKGLAETFHGEQIGVATLTMARLQERLLAAPPRVEATAVDEGEITRHFGSEVGAACLAEFRAKALDREAAERVNAVIADAWGEIAPRIGRALGAPERLAAVLRAAGAPTDAGGLGWTEAFYRTAVARARQIRNRYTFLDLAGDGGVLDRFAAAA